MTIARIHHYTEKRLQKGFQRVRTNPEITLEIETCFAICTTDDLLAQSVDFKIVLISQNCHSKWISPVFLFNGKFVFTNKEMRHACKREGLFVNFILSQSASLVHDPTVLWESCSTAAKAKLQNLGFYGKDVSGHPQNLSQMFLQTTAFSTFFNCW